MKRLIPFVLVLLLIACYACQPKMTATDANKEISKDFVEEVLTTLASDKMEGRKSGTKGAKLAADYIARKFKEIGLQPLNSEGSYLQPFQAMRASEQTVSLSLDGNKVNESQLLGLSNQKDFTWSSMDGIQVITVNNANELKASFKSYKTWTQPTLVKIKRSVAPLFNQYRSYYRSERLEILDSKVTKQVIWAVTSAEDISSLQAHFTQKATISTLQNVVGVLPGKSDKTVVFSGHYDHIGIIEAVKGDSIANGADDDASGTTAVIALAKYFKEKQIHQRTLVFVAFTAEEFGMYGSKFFADSIDPKKTIANINIEMIGKTSVFGAGKAFVTGNKESNLLSILQKNKPKTFMADPYPRLNLFYRSDNVSFVNKGVIAHTISTCQIDKDEYYHTVDDEISTMDFNQITLTIRNIATGVESLVTGEDKPVWHKTK